MDNLTHSLVGALIGQTGLKRKTGLAMPALIIGANLPDVDAACFFWLESVEHLAFRRGITHGPPAWLMLPLALAGLLWAFDRWQTKRGRRPEKRLPVSFKWLYLLSLIGCLTHPALDWMNSYGIRFLEPFSSRWFYGDVLFIIDIWLWVLMGAAVWSSLRREKRGGDWRRPARAALSIGLGYIAMNAAITWWNNEVRSASFEDSIASPVPGAFWDRERIEPLDRGRWLIDGVEVGDCALDPIEAEARNDLQVAAFLFWSRAPFAEGAPDGVTLLRDARFYDPMARDRFTVILPDVACEPLD